MILDVFPSYKDKDMVDLLYRYERETCLSLNILVEKYLEEVLYKNGYLNAGIEDEEPPEEEISPEVASEDDDLKYIYKNPDGGLYRVQRKINGESVNFGTHSLEMAKKVRNFMIIKNWDINYSSKVTGLRGKNYSDWFYSEIEKEENND